SIAGPELFGILLLALSLVAPDSIGEGGFIPIRLRLLGTLALLPAIAAVLRRLRPRVAYVLCTVLVAAFAARSYWMIADARAVHDERMAVSALVMQAGASKGSWLAGRLTAYRRRPFRIGAYRHLAERVAIDQQLVVLNNYEALNG